MCGIAVLVFDDPRGTDHVERRLSAMCQAQRYRGPDGTYLWTDGRIGFGAVRLAIVGSAAHGKQPIPGEAGNRLVYNGELYEPGKVMASLGESFPEGACDGMALLRLLEKRGLDGLSTLSAMFALALHRPQDDSVLLARDAHGQKPLYRTRFRGGWAFASTIAALHAAAGPFRIRPAAMQEALIFKSVGGHASAFTGVEQICPGGWMRILRDGSVQEGRWFTREQPQHATADASRVHDLLCEAINMRASTRFRSAVFLSGGLDSSIVAAVSSQDCAAPKPRALTVGYDVAGWQDERALAIRLAEEFHMGHGSVTVAASDVPGLLAEAAVALEDPVHDPVVVPTLALAHAAVKDTKVVLTGDGSDEFWGGYERFDDPPGSLDAYLERTMVFCPEELGLDAIPADYLTGIDVEADGSMAPLDMFMRLETKNRLRNYHLSRVDKLTMSTGLEARSPFLDIGVTRYADSLTAAEKRPAGRPKGLLIDAFRTKLPEWLLARRKQPFTVPIETWLQGPLRDFVFDTLGPGAFVRHHVDPDPLLATLSTAEFGTAAAQRLWSLVHLETWHREFAQRMGQP